MQYFLFTLILFPEIKSKVEDSQSYCFSLVPLEVKVFKIYLFQTLMQFYMLIEFYYFLLSGFYFLFYFKRFCGGSQ